MNNTFPTRLNNFKQEISAICDKCGRTPNSVRIIGVSKTKPTEMLQDAIDAGMYDLGENKVQEIVQKVPHLTGDFEMHMIGHLQTNKINKVVPLVSWIHSIDSIRLAEKVSLQCEKLQKSIKVLIQVNTSAEESKSGCLPEIATELAHQVNELPHLEFKGFMTIGPLTSNKSEIKNSFIQLRKIGERNKHLSDTIELSMGMSGDYEMAIEEGSTMIRVGTLLFGGRVYK